MKIQVRCEDCGQGYRLKPSLAGKIVPCKECGADLRVPRPRGGRSSGEIRTRGGRSSGELRTRGGRSSGELRTRSENGGGATVFWIIGGLAIFLMLVGTGVFLWKRTGDSPAKKESADASEDDPVVEEDLPPNTWAAPAVGVANLGPEIAIGRYSIRAPKGWMLANCRYGGNEATLEWKWPDPELKAKLEFRVDFNTRHRQGDKPNIIVDGGSRSLGRGHTYLYIGADDPVEGRINGVDFHRVDFPGRIRNEPNTHSEYIAILEGAAVQITTDVMLPKEMKLCAHAEAAALSFKANSTAKPLLTMEDLRQSRRLTVKGYPKPQSVAENLADWGIRPKHDFLGEPELVILCSDDDAKEAIISTPKPNYIAIKGVVYSLLEQGKEVGRFTIPSELEDLKHKALSDDGKTMAFADQYFSREDGKIHLLTEGGKTLRHLQESRARSIGSLRLEFIRFLPDQHLAAGWRMSPKEEVDVYNLKTGKQTRFSVESAEGDSVAFSPDSRFVAFIHEETNRLVLDQVNNPGQLTGLRSPSNITRLYSSLIKGLAFSADGTQLAGIVSGRLVCWSINGGLLLDKRLPTTWATYSVDGSPPLTWLDDGSGWLVWGRHILSRDDAGLRWFVP